MKHLLVATIIALTVVVPAYAGGEMKEVCKEVTDSKTGKTKQECKKVKVHKKLEPTTPGQPATAKK